MLSSKVSISTVIKSISILPVELSRDVPDPRSKHTVISSFYKVMMDREGTMKYSLLFSLCIVTFPHPMQFAEIEFYRRIYLSLNCTLLVNKSSLVMLNYVSREINNCLADFWQFVWRFLHSQLLRLKASTNNTQGENMMSSFQKSQSNQLPSIYSFVR